MYPTGSYWAPIINGEQHQELDFGPWVLAKKDFTAKIQISAKGYLESHRSRSEPWNKWAK